MKLKVNNLFCLFVIFTIQHGQSQEPVYSDDESHYYTPYNASLSLKGISLVGGTISFHKQKGEIHNLDDNSISSLGVNISYLYFVQRSFGIGANLGVQKTENGDERYTNLSIGPEFAYYFGGSESFMPYFNTSIGYLYSKNADQDEKEEGMRLNFRFGFLILRDHLGLQIEIKNSTDNFGNGDTGNIFQLGVGVSGLFYREDE